MSTATLQTPETKLQPVQFAATPEATSLAQIPLLMIVPSDTNPRKTFSEQGLNELAASIQQSGLQQAVLLRPWIARAEDVQKLLDLNLDPPFEIGAEIFQIVMGERRWRATLRTDRKTIRAEVRAVSNQEAIIIQQIENLQREDLDPIEQAESFEALIKQGMSGNEIAQRVGKSPQWVSSMKRLNTLAPFGKDFLRRGWISEAHAVLIARLGDTGLQEQAFRAIFGAVSPADYKSATITAAIEPFAESGRPIMSEKTLREWIANNIICDLKKVPWDLADADLYPAAGACIGCEHNTGTDQALFAGIVGDGDRKCANPTCFNTKIQRTIQREIDNADMTESKLVQITVRESNEPLKDGARIVKQGQWVRAEKGDCKDTVQAIMRDGPEAGHLVYVCTSHRCKKHPHNSIEALHAAEGMKEAAGKAPFGGAAVSAAADAIKAEAAGQGAARVGNTTSTTAVQPQQSERERKLNYARQMAENAMNETIIERVLAAEVKPMKTPDEGLLREVVTYFSEIMHIDLYRTVTAMGFDAEKTDPAETFLTLRKKGSLAELTRLIFLMLVPDNLPIDGPDFKAHAKRAGVDVARIRKEMEAKIADACFYCGCTELTPCEGGCDRSRMHGEFHFCDAKACREQFEREFHAPIERLPKAETKTSTAKDAKPLHGAAKAKQPTQAKSQPKPKAAAKAKPTKKKGKR